MINYMKIVKSQQYFISRHQLCSPTLPSHRFLHSSITLQNIKKETIEKSTKETSQKETKDLYYYEIPGNKLNPHNYFYRVLAVPYMKFCGIIIITYYTLNGLWEYLESQNKDN